MWSLTIPDHLQNEEDRRSGHERRGFLPRRCILEKRSGRDRRIGLDRQIGKEAFENILEPKRKRDEFIEFPRIVRDLIECICLCLLVWGLTIISIHYVFRG